jgi:hypothetical protein
MFYTNTEVHSPRMTHKKIEKRQSYSFFNYKTFNVVHLLLYS